MESFPFDFSLNYKMENCNIKPPANFSLLSEVISEKYDLKISNIFFIDDNGAEKPIKNDTDYSNLLMSASEQNVKEVEIIIKSNEDMSQKRKKSMRKRSSMKQSSDFSIKPKAVKGSGDDEDDTYANDMMCDYDYYGDTRNQRVGMEEGKWSNQCTNFKDNRRIYYIKMKKEMQKREQKERNGDIIEEDEDEFEGKRKNKRRLKEHNKKEDDDQMNVDSDENEGKKGKKKGRKNKH